jgi:hypothetical protein
MGQSDLFTWSALSLFSASQSEEDRIRKEICMNNEEMIEKLMKEDGRKTAFRRLWYAGAALLVNLILYYGISGGTGRFGILGGMINGVSALLLLVFLILSIYGFIKYR